MSLGFETDTDTSENRFVDDFIREALQMRSFDHPNVMHLIGICWTLDDPKNSPRIAPLIVLPYMELGDLKKFLQKGRIERTEEDIHVRGKVLSLYSIAVEFVFQRHLVDLPRLVKFCLQIAKGMEYLVSKGIIHRDLAARNCM